jgi:hypothetical protein
MDYKQGVISTTIDKRKNQVPGTGNQYESRNTPGEVCLSFDHYHDMDNAIEHHRYRKQPGKWNSKMIFENSQKECQKTKKINKDITTDKKRTRHLA